ncbi:MAG: AAA family ATPase [candidate division KSB1 bacterium]|nr:AAA family ATPase [candidate division KSB1 bacterium]MDZ7295068.1 AAA family ATPase [candidate division KSB1 bacterium]MDZ7384495.1 AAA family ATPase [candidate division KSB1 bacterium]MDZ7412696.1 AAA family ATPase [candidate division KSB1 bacterium]
MTKPVFEEVPAERLRWRCDPASLPFASTAEVSMAEKILGQDRAVRALRMGLEINSVGYNIFVTGQAGTGRTTTVRHLLAGRRGERIPDDKLYVNNFKNPDSPLAISLPAGRGRAFRKDMADAVAALRRQIPQLFESDQYAQRRQRLVDTYSEQERKVVAAFEERVSKEGFAVIQVQVGPMTKPDLVPIIEGSPVPMEQLDALVSQQRLPAETAARLKEKYPELLKELPGVLKELRKTQATLRQKLSELDTQFARELVGPLIADLKEKYRDEKVQRYLDDVQESILERLDLFRGRAEGEGSREGGPPEADPFLDYQVNLIVDNADTKGAPVIFESTPTYKNLFGTIERVMDSRGMWRADFTKIKAGSFLRANGGFLVINALDALVEPGVWQALKRTLRNRQVEIQSFDPFFMFTTSALKPEPIATDVKVIMIGDPWIYQVLYYQDDDFKKIFKVKADFDSVMPRGEPNVLQYASFIRKICEEEKLLHFDREAVAAVVEYGVRLAGRQTKLSTRFNYIADLVREAHYWATQDKAKVVTAKHVDKALEEKIERVSLIEDKIREMIAEGTLIIDTEGSKVGQVNGLSIIDLGDYAFAHPCRITAQTAMGRAGIINIEREAEMSGPTHNKGVLILAGYLRGKFAQDKPLSMSASICFEQNYSGVDGDSASSTEIYALLSSLADLPLRQDIAVTGSVNQKGEIQPIGGVNEKIEGFFRVCKVRGLTGRQGVIIPRRNVQDLALHKEVVEAVKKGKFHIYPVDTIDQGITILTGVPAGERGPDGRFPEGTVNARVDARLRELAEGLRQFAPSQALERE